MSPDDLALIHLTPADHARVVALWLAAGLPIKPAGRDSLASFTRQIDSGCQTVIGLEAPGGQLAGVVLATHDSRRGWINRLAVHPDYRRQGLALRLIAAAEQHLSALGLPVISAHVETWNEASIALFARAGYVAANDVIYFSKRERNDV